MSDPKNFWLHRWSENDTPWHQREVEPLLAKHFLERSKRILVPLCGKSIDMLWLRSQGHEVVGVELSPVACEDFYKEANIPYQVVKRQGFQVFSSDKIEIWCGDFFDIPLLELKPIEIIYDRAALYALPSSTREKYVGRIIELYQAQKVLDFKMYVLGREDSLGSPDGPPFQVDESEIKRLYGKYFKVDVVDSMDRDSRRYPGILVKETIYKLLARSAFVDSQSPILSS